MSAERADPAIWKKIDPFERMSVDEIKRLHCPDVEDPLRLRAVVEGNSVCLVDPARDAP